MEYIKRNSFILKLAIFATGFAGIVAEYVLSTLATYFIGNSVFQWTMIVSLMLFCMGLGSRLSKLFKTNLIRNFLLLELSLSLIVAFSSVLVYTLAAISSYYDIIIYFLSMLVGLLIGLGKKVGWLDHFCPLDPWSAWGQHQRKPREALEADQNP